MMKADISVYQVFQILMGIIISGFVLYILLDYAGVYSSLGEKTQNLMAMNNFRAYLDNVYLLGTPQPFDEFSERDIELRFEGRSLPPSIISGEGEISIYTPAFLSFGGSGEGLFLERNSIDYGFYNLYFVEAVPKLNVLFSTDGGPGSWELIRRIVEALPDTTDKEPKVSYGFCDRKEAIERMCGGKPCEKNDFLSILKQDKSGVSFSECTRNPQKSQRIIRVSESCNQKTPDICLTPEDEDGMGLAYLNGSKESFIYSDKADLAALVIGGSEKDALGRVNGEKLYDYKNAMFRERLDLVAKIMDKRLDLLIRKLLVLDLQRDCLSAYSELLKSLKNLQALLSDKSYYKDNAKTLGLKNGLESSRILYVQAVDKGCDY